MASATEKQRDYIVTLMRKIYNPYGTGVDDDALVGKVEAHWNVDFTELTSEEAHTIINSIKGFRESSSSIPIHRKNGCYQPRPTPDPACGLCGDPGHRLDNCPKNPIYRASLKIET